MNRPPLQGMLEFGLYVEDVERAAAFYRRLFGFRPLVSNERIGALDVESKQILLLFKHGASTEPMKVPGGVLPPHDGKGTSHLAFAIQTSDLDQWELWLGEQDVEIESTIEWERGGRSLYFRDLACISQRRSLRGGGE
ncbi:MAG: VOC family protein, partial [Acidobacteriota bacterium]